MWHAGDSADRPEPLPWVVQAWWALWVVSGAISFLSRRESPDGLKFAEFAALVLLHTVGVVFAIGVVRRLTDRLVAVERARLRSAPASA